MPNTHDKAKIALNSLTYLPKRGEIDVLFNKTQACKMIIKGFVSAMLALAFTAVASLAHAQYAWIDEKGIKQFSDMPPPAHIKQDRILKQPGAEPRSMASNSKDSVHTPSPQIDKSNVPLTIAEKNAEFNKRKMERVEQERKAAEKVAFNAAKAKNCERARNYNNSLKSGQRIVTTDSNGERIYLNDEQRAQEMREAQSVLANC